MPKKITLEQTWKLLEHLTRTLGEVSLKVDKLEGKKKMRTDGEILIEVAKYTKHRILKHEGCGIFKALTKDELKVRINKIIPNLENKDCSLTDLVEGGILNS